MADYLLLHDTQGTPSLVPLDTDDDQKFGAIIGGFYVPIDPAELSDFCEGCQ